MSSRRFRSVLRPYPWILVATMTSGCAAMIANFFDDPAAEMTHAVAVQNPARTGRVDAQAVESSVGATRMLSYDKASTTLCFEVESPYSIADFDTSLKGFSVPTKELEAAPGIKAATVQRKGSKTKTYTYQDKQTTTYKDSSGQAVGSAETPVTRTGVQELGVYKVCFKSATVPAPTTKYLVMLHQMKGLFGTTTYRESWQFEE